MIVFNAGSAGSCFFSWDRDTVPPTSCAQQRWCSTAADTAELCGSHPAPDPFSLLFPDCSVDLNEGLHLGMYLYSTQRVWACWHLMKKNKPTGFDHKVRQIKCKKRSHRFQQTKTDTSLQKKDPGLRYLSSLRITTSARNL